MTTTSAAAAPAPDTGILDALERHRDFHFRRIPARRVTGEKSALKFIGEVGFCTGFPSGLGVPCLREAISGTREPVMPEHIHLLISEPERGTPSTVMQVLKQRYARRVLKQRQSAARGELMMVAMPILQLYDGDGRGSRSKGPGNRDLGVIAPPPSPRRLSS